MSDGLANAIKQNGPDYSNAGRKGIYTPEGEEIYKREQAELKRELAELGVDYETLGRRAVKPEKCEERALEQPHHRLIVNMRANGLKPKQIAEFMDMTDQAVRGILKQPWAKAQLIKLLGDQGKDLVMEMVSDEALDCIHTLVEIRENKDAPASARISACQELLNRKYGKPTQVIKDERERVPTDIDQLNSDIAAMEAELERGQKKT